MTGREETKKAQDQQRQLKLGVFPLTRGQALHSRALDPQNPRPYLFEGPDS